MGNDGGSTPTRTRNDAAAMIAELWAEREQALSSPATQAKGRVPRATVEPERPPAGGKERALATLVVLLLVGAGLGIVAKEVGLIGAPSKASFVAEAEALCTAGNIGVSSMSTPVGYAALATAASTLAANAETQLGQLRALDLPGGADRGRARGVLNAMEATSQAGRGVQSAAETSDPAMTAVTARSMTVYADDAVAKAQAFGFTACVAGMKPGIDAVLAGAKGAVKISFTEKAATACLEMYRAAEALPPIRNASDLSRHIDKSVAIFDKLATDLRALPVPPGDEAAVTAITTQITSVGAKTREMGNAGLAGDVKRVNAIDKEVDAMLDDLSKKFGAYGQTVCGE